MKVDEDSKSSPEYVAFEKWWNEQPVAERVGSSKAFCFLCFLNGARYGVNFITADLRN